MKIKIKRLRPDAKMPTRGTKHAAAFDLYAAESVMIKGANQWEGVKIPTGLAFEIPEGYCGVVYSRSSSAINRWGITPLIVDSDYRGEVYVTVDPRLTRDTYVEVEKGQRLAQIKIEKLEPTEFEWADELSETERGSGGYGSTGK